MKKGHIYFIMGPSGSGKGTLIKNIKNLNAENLHMPLSYRSRPKRENEVDGIDSYFISKEKFISGIEAGDFLEYAIVHDTYYYGTKYIDVIDNGIKKGYKVMKELDINGLIKLRNNNKNFGNDYTTIFLNIPVNILKNRIRLRGDTISNDELDNRIKSAISEETSARKICDYMIDATKTEQEVFEEIKKIMKLN